jgi:predicted XRE-type DNA-binding protein
MPADPILTLRKQAIKAINARLALLAESSEDTPTQGELAEMLGLTRPRLHLLRNERVAEFSLEALLRVAMRVDLRVQLKLTRPYSGT